MTITYLHVIHSLDPKWGGPAEGVKQLAAAALRLKHAVEVVTFEPPHASWSREFECPIHFIGPNYLFYGYSPSYRSWLQRNASRFDAIVINGLWQYHSMATWSVLRGTGTPYYVFTHGMLDPWFKRSYPLKHVKKSVYWRIWERRVLRDARAVLFTSEEERRLASQTFGRYKANELVVNYGVAGANGNASQQREMFLQRFPELRGMRLLVFLARIHEKKGCDLLIEAFAQVARTCQKLRLVMAGPDERGLLGKLQQRCEDLGIGMQVVWTGLLGYDLKYGALHAAEAFVLPSHQENFGLAVAEALSCGTPVLISDKVNIWREVLEDHAGLVADDTLDGTTRLLQDWLEMSDGGRARLAANAVSCFQRRFNSDAAARSLISTIERGGIERRQVA
jgi:glycosyltransferase involved in cell wall biosynthesis